MHGIQLSEQSLARLLLHAQRRSEIPQISMAQICDAPAQKHLRQASVGGSRWRWKRSRCKPVGLCAVPEVQSRCGVCLRVGRMRMRVCGEV